MICIIIEFRIYKSGHPWYHF